LLDGRRGNDPLPLPARLLDPDLNYGASHAGPLSARLCLVHCVIEGALPQPALPGAGDRNADTGLEPAGLFDAHGLTDAPADRRRDRSDARRAARADRIE